MTKIKGVNDNLLFFLYQKLYKEHITSTDKLISLAALEGYDEITLRNALITLQQSGLISPVEEEYSYGFNTADFMISSDFEKLF